MEFDVNFKMNDPKAIKALTTFLISLGLVISLITGNPAAGLVAMLLHSVLR